MTHHLPIQTRFYDTDALGHLNNSSFTFYVEAARIEFLKEVGVPVNNLILARIALDFRKQVTFGQSLRVETIIGRLGNSSVTLLQKVFADDVLACETESVVVHFDYEANKPASVPDEVRARLRVYLISGA